MKFVYCILAYNEPVLLKRTIKRLQSPNSLFIIHVQKSVDITPFLIKEANVFFIPEHERIETIWGDITCVQATLLMFNKAIKLTSGHEGYCILMSGQDYPIKNTEYIESYLSKHYPKNFYQYAHVNSREASYKRMIDRNLCNYWISFPNTKLKIEISPKRYILPRCIDPYHELFYQLPKIFVSLPKILKIFFAEKRNNPYHELTGENYCASATWMQLTLSTVEKIVRYKNSALFERAKYIHNPEERLLQNIIEIEENYIKREDYLLSTENYIMDL